jgi:hypothetical protein
MSEGMRQSSLRVTLSEHMCNNLLTEVNQFSSQQSPQAVKFARISPHFFVCYSGKEGGEPLGPSRFETL